MTIAEKEELSKEARDMMLNLGYIPREGLGRDLRASQSWLLPSSAEEGKELVPVSFDNPSPTTKKQKSIQVEEAMPYQDGELAEAINTSLEGDFFIAEESHGLGNGKDQGTGSSKD